MFDFVIPKSRRSPERIINAINRPNKDAAMNFVTAWFDTHEVRPPESKAYAFLNDMDQPIPIDVTDALKNYEVKPVPWSIRDTVKDELAS